MAAAIHLRRDLHARVFTPHVQRSHALRPVDFVRAHRHQIDVVLYDVDRNLAHGLHPVGMEQDAFLMRDFADFADRLDHADFVVGIHERNQDRLVRDRIAQHVQIHQTVAFHRQIAYAVAVLFELLASVQHRFMLGRYGDDVIALFRVHLGYTLDRQVVGLGRAAGEDDFFGCRANQIRNLLPRVIHRFLRFPAEAVIAAGRVPELFHEKGHHGLDDPGVDGRRRMIIKINGRLHRRSSQNM